MACRHARPRLARCALASLPGDCWRELQALPAFNELPQALAAAALAAASRDPVWVRRDAGLRIVSVEAVAYLEAGGQLTREEEVELREHQQMRALCAQHAQQVQQAQQTQQAYEVTQEDLEASDLNEEYPSMQWQLKQPSQSEYEQSSEMWTALARFACPHLAAEIERRVRVGAARAAVPLVCRAAAEGIGSCAAHAAGNSGRACLTCESPLGRAPSLSPNTPTCLFAAAAAGQRVGRR